MDQAELLPSLNLMTLIGIVLIVAVGLLLFLRKRSNRHPMEKSPDGAIATVRTDETTPR